MDNLKKLRKKYNLTQKEVSKITNLPLRTYIRYERDDSYGSTHKRKYILSILINKYQISETKGILTLKEIKDTINELFNKKYKNNIEYCYLFGSYAKNEATNKSNLNLIIKTNLKGIELEILNEDMKKLLHKKIDLITPEYLLNNQKLLNEVMKYGIKIYG